MTTAFSHPARDNRAPMDDGRKRARWAKLQQARWRYICGAVLVAMGLVPQTAHASMFHGETLDSIANVLAWVVLAVVPIIGIAVFWLVHILPEKIAYKAHHPQARAIHTLCLLSLFFGGLLWPLAWLWAYTKPVLHKMAYGTDVDDSHGKVDEQKVETTAASEAELQEIRQQLIQLAEKLQATTKGRKA